MEGGGKTSGKDGAFETLRGGSMEAAAAESRKRPPVSPECHNHQL